ncbi:ribosomal protein S18 acetylase RimI-like enzyme [Chryseobacterium vietnamense]|uniref:Ribosomal protein S18 acetylase RimI-like enzyme n=1 Tax=Chryseobacterium vietnamense TaxID=866785 RepID=A0ACC6J7T3_9FLAO|nr:GNAT family N-acetyltransferase [Chryseobacterium vietnamense]MDR6459009.1 ribosomal protein S18 acetylase RimI-like enzyme [Chryseobacterium vietnamense]
MEFKTLADITIDELLSVFNHSFSDYVVPFHLTKEVLVSKIAAEKLDLSLSAGAFEEGKLVGFILQSEKIENGEKIIYNGGTGVIPESRGRGLVRKMYDFIIPVLKERNANTLLLEVIEGNQPAIRAYENLGFSIVRRLLCFNGSIKQGKENAEVAIKDLKGFQWEKLRSFWDIEPSWQGSVFVLEPMPENYVTLGAYIEEKLVGYIVYGPTSKKIYQFAVDKSYRNQGVGTMLFNAISKKNGGQTIALNNVDDSSESTSKFLSEKTGLNNWLSQFEMKRPV